jgi:hypothetical protein
MGKVKTKKRSGNQWFVERGKTCSRSKEKYNFNRAVGK